MNCHAWPAKSKNTHPQASKILPVHSRTTLAHGTAPHAPNDKKHLRTQQHTHPRRAFTATEDPQRSWEPQQHSDDDDQALLALVVRDDIKLIVHKFHPKQHGSQGVEAVAQRRRACPEVENAIYKHPDVLEACVFGIPDERLGEVLCSAIYLKEDSNLSEDDLRQFLSDKLAAFKIPSIIEFMKTNLPLVASGKFDKPALREIFNKN